MWDAQGRFPGPDLLCRLVKYLQVLGMFASSYMIVAMTVDRHYAICCPLQAHRSSATQGRNSIILTAWSLSLLLSLPQVGGLSDTGDGSLSKHREKAAEILMKVKMTPLVLLPLQVFIFSRSEVAPGVFECWGHFAPSWGLKAYVTWMALAVFILPTLVITVCQVRIFREIHNNLYQRSGRRPSPASLSPSKRGSCRGGGRRRSSPPLCVPSLPGSEPGPNYQNPALGPVRFPGSADCTAHTCTGGIH